MLKEILHREKYEREIEYRAQIQVYNFINKVFLKTSKRKQKRAKRKN